MPAICEPTMVLPKPIPDFELPVEAGGALSCLSHSVGIPQDSTDAREFASKKAKRRTTIIVTKLEASHLCAASEFIVGNPEWILLWAPEVSSQQAALLELAFDTFAVRGKHKKRPNIWVFTDKHVPFRICSAIRDGVASETIADAKIEDGMLEVLTCDLDIVRVDTQKSELLSCLSPLELQNFELDAWGNYISWPDAGIDMDLHAIKFESNEEYRLEFLQGLAKSEQRLGAAIRQLRQEANLRQSDFPGLNERELRRIEANEVSFRQSTFKKLADGFGLSIEDFLDMLSKKMDSIPRE